MVAQCRDVVAQWWGFGSPMVGVWWRNGGDVVAQWRGYGSSMVGMW